MHEEEPAIYTQRPPPAASSSQTANGVSAFDVFKKKMDERIEQLSEQQATLKRDNRELRKRVEEDRKKEVVS